jgi:hypothetical protein
MCGRVRLGTDFSQIRIKLKFDQAAAAPNVPASWNVCPTDPMLWLLARTASASPANAMGARAVVGEGHQSWFLVEQCACGERG